jgi:hypothetical protein
VTSIVTSMVPGSTTTTTEPAARVRATTTTRQPATTTTRRRATTTTTKVPGRSCDPAYPDLCIPPPPPDLDCADVNGGDFTVLPPDPHGFDREGDGVGCET